MIPFFFFKKKKKLEMQIIPSPPTPNRDKRCRLIYPVINVYTKQVTAYYKNSKVQKFPENFNPPFGSRENLEKRKELRLSPNAN